MLAEQTKKTVMALVQETTEGTPVKPTLGTQYVALQDGFELEPAFDTLENAELTGSIGRAKSIQGLENPAASLSHYIRHSGVEGQEPNYGLLLYGAFGDKKVVATERDTVGGSTAGDSTTAAVVNVDAGEGVEFERGQAILLKDGVNGYSIRNVLSVAVDALTLAQNLSAAPALGVNLGKAVMYKPGESHPTMSIWNFRGNGAALEMISGARVTEMSMEINAGELINGSFSMEGIKYYFNPIEVVAGTNDDIDATDDGGAFTATVAAGVYRDPHDLAAAIQTALNAAGTDNWTVTYDDVTGKFTIASDGVTTQLNWDTGANTATSIGPDIGFSVAADDTGANTYTSDNAIDLSQLQSPAFDDSDPLVAKANEVMIGNFADIGCFRASTMTLTLANTKADVLAVCADSGKEGSLITDRELTIEVTATLDKYEADKFKRFRTNQETQFTYNFGVKDGGNWVAGKCGNVFVPTATISEFKLGDNDGLVTLEMTLTAYVKSGLGEVYLNFL